MTASAVALMGFAALCNAVANVQLKTLSSSVRSSPDAFGLASAWPHAVFLVLSAGGLLAAYAAALRVVPLHVAYAAVTGGALVLLYGWSLIQGRTLPDLNGALGLAAIMLGMSLLAGAVR